jgi:peptide/nickel transport system ATP-binding protein
VPGDLCRTVQPDLVPGRQGLGHLKRCHLADPDAVYAQEVLPEIDPELAQELADELPPAAIDEKDPQ